MAKFVPFILLIYPGLFCLAQEAKIDTDRPDQTESASIVPKNYFQAEFGFNKENTSSASYNLLHPTSLLKYGFARFELRLETVFQSSYQEGLPQSKWNTGLEPVELGFKVLLAEEKKIIPKTSLIVHLGVPMLSSKSFRYDRAAPSFRFTVQKTLYSFLGVGANLGAEWDGFTPVPIWLYTLSPGFIIGEKWYAYVEVFGFIQSNELPQHNLDAGVAYYLTNDIKIDLSAGAGISFAAPKNYVALGISFRINTKPNSHNSGKH